MKKRWYVEAVGVSLLLVFPYFSPLVLPGHKAIYHHPRPLGHLIGGLLIDMAVIALLGLAFLYLSSRLAPRIRAILGALAASIILSRVVQTVMALFFGWSLRSIRNRAMESSSKIAIAARFISVVDLCWKHFYTIAICSSFLLLIVACVFPNRISPVIRTARVAVAAFAFCTLWVVPQLLYFTFALRSDNGGDPPLSQKPVAGRRIVWMLFDELSYALVLDHPQGGQAYPNFDRLRAQSVAFADVQPFDLYTERILPSLFVNRQLNQLESNMDGTLLNLDPEHKHWVEFDPGHSLFADAQKQGWNPAIAGWYNPYCRLLGSLLTTCKWTPGIETFLPIENLGASEDSSALANAIALPRQEFNRLLGGPDRSEDYLGQHNVDDYRSLMTQSKELIQDGRLHFVFLHLPVPHPPGAYDRKNHTLCACGNYLDNLALADSALGELRQEIDRTPWAAQTTIIVSSDHSWRVPLWRGNSDWTPEEERVSQGKFDPRPVFLVHFVNQTTPTTIREPVPELKEHDVIDSMLNGAIGDPQDLEASVESSPAR